MYAYGAVVTACTGLEGYDQQLDLGLSEAIEHIDEAVAAFDSAASIIAERRDARR